MVSEAICIFKIIVVIPSEFLNHFVVVLKFWPAKLKNTYYHQQTWMNFSRILRMKANDFHFWISDSRNDSVGKKEKKKLITFSRFCMYLISNLLFSILGDKSTNPNEACMNYYFDAENSPIITLVSEGGHNTRPCPFSGRYTLTGAPHTGAMSALMSGQLNCHQAIMHAGCSASDDLIVESVCSRNLEDNVR